MRYFPANIPVWGVLLRVLGMIALALSAWPVLTLAGSESGSGPATPPAQVLEAHNLHHARAMEAAEPSPAAQAHSSHWETILAAARGQTVYWHAWGGDVRTNEFIQWVSNQLEAAHGVRVQQVKLSDTAEAVQRVLAEKTAGKHQDGAVDLIWINGPNFLAMQEAGLLYGPFLDSLPNARYLDRSPGAPAVTDFTVPTEGYSAPWRLARFVLTHESARVPVPPARVADFAAWVVAHPGRFTHPAVHNFMGATFLKQLLVELAPDPGVLAHPVTDAAFAAATAPLWDWYDTARPHLWRRGRMYPENESVLAMMLNDGEVDFSMAFDPGAAAALVERGLLPETVRSYAPAGGSLGNVSFVAIPYNARNRAGAQVVANFLLDPATQAHAQNLQILGAFSVLDFDRLDPPARAAFTALPTAPALPRLEDLGPTLAEPHPDWMVRLVAAWTARYLP